MPDPIHILYVDDEPDLLEIGKVFLEKDGSFFVETDTSASDALLKLESERYDAILSDYQMPGMDGIGFLKRFRAAGNTTPFIIFTGRGREEVVIEALNNGADFYIQKGGEVTSQFAELSNKIRYAVARKKSEEALGVSEVLEKELEYHERELMKFYNESLDAANKKLKLLSAITRHDIITQLTALQLYHEMLEQQLPDPSFRDYFKKIGIATDRIASIIRFTQQYEEIGVNTPVWNNIRAIVDAGIRHGMGRNLRIINDLPEGTEVNADALIANVLYNLMDNAARYGDRVTLVRFSLQESGDSGIILCEDDGIGVPDEEREQIFERSAARSAGMSLALSREILALTGITIRETGEPGMGARFEMAVPKGVWRIASEH